MKCPRCGKRAFDISVLPKIPVIIELKCPNCHRVVEVDLSLRRGNVKYRLVRVK